ncbi:hypothetical protein [Streptomyces sp. NPDC088258]|uniref:DUF7847 domain-containing protein n=1 Tax=Streptomyces sp. NPDC088258 TaxID=3365849 RepID=UPI003827284F
MTQDGAGQGGTGQGEAGRGGGEPFGNGPHSGGGWGGWAPPPPPRPGVIPLGPLRTSDILGGAFSTFGRYWKQLLGTALVAYGPAVLAMATALVGMFFTLGGDLVHVFGEPSHPEDLWSRVGPAMIWFFGVWVIGVALMAAATALIHAACPAIVQEAVLGRPTTFGTVLRRAWARFFPTLGTLALTTLITLAPVVLVGLVYGGVLLAFVTTDAGSRQLVWLIPLGLLALLTALSLAVWLWVRLSLAPAAVVIESRSPIAALRRSKELVRGAWWRIFGVSMLAGILAGMVGGILQQVVSVLGMVSGGLDLSGDGSTPDPAQFLPFFGGFMALGLVAALISQILTTVFPQLVLNLLYVDQRIRNENLGPVLASAASETPAP